MANMLCKCAQENDLIPKNYAEFIKVPKFEKNEKLIFTDEQIAPLFVAARDLQNVALPEGWR